ncbi:MAG TPA: PEP-CTERM sorting domain-containing protein [Gemmatimonadales bacterium]
MPLPRLPCAAALMLGLVVAVTPVAAQDAPHPLQASDALFHGYLTGPVAAISLPLEASGESGFSEEEDQSAPGWLGGNGYLVGGATALAAGIALASGNDASPVPSSTPTIQPVVAPTTRLPGVQAPAPGAVNEANVIVNPEPGTMLLLGTGLAVVALVGRRKMVKK